MASRTTLEKAQNLKVELEVRHPHAQFRIIDNSKKRHVGREAAEADGYKIIEDGEIMVLAMVTRFDVLEVRHCDCGAEILTVAIGEHGLDECTTCRTERQTRQKQALAERCERGHQAIAASVAFDEYSEPW